MLERDQIGASVVGGEGESVRRKGGTIVILECLIEQTGVRKLHPIDKLQIGWLRLHQCSRLLVEKCESIPGMGFTLSTFIVEAFRELE